MLSTLKQVVIYGAGMMGASLAHSLKVHPKFQGSIVAIVRSESSAQFLRTNQLADMVDVNVAPGSVSKYRPDLVVLGLPVLSVVETLKQLDVDCLVTDLGSTRLTIEKAARSTNLKFVGSHPMCGSEVSGPSGIVTDLFKNRLCIVIDRIDEKSDKAQSADPAWVLSINEFWQELGMKTYHLDAATHDRIVAGLSHAPHFISSALARTFTDFADILTRNQHSPVSITGGGLRDMLRIAGSNPGMWHDIMATNRSSIVDFLKSFRLQIDQLIDQCSSNEFDWVFDYQNQAYQVRNQLYDTKMTASEQSPAFEGGVSVSQPFQVISLDGPAGSGKSTVAGILAKELGYLHADSGALYRSLTWACIGILGEQKNHVEFGKKFAENTPDVSAIDLQVEFHDGRQLNLLAGEDASPFIRSIVVTERIRYIADCLPFREKVNQLLQKLATKTSMVVDGRDIGTVVFPDTGFKFYLDAAVTTRAERRLKEMLESGLSAPSLAELESQIEQRDNEDRNRKVGALQIPPLAIIIDTSNIDKDMVVSMIRAHLQDQF